MVYLPHTKGGDGMIELCGIKMYTIKEFKVMTKLGKNKVNELFKNRLIEHVDFNGVRMVTDPQIKDALNRLTVRKESPKLYSRP